MKSSLRTAVPLALVSLNLLTPPAFATESQADLMKEATVTLTQATEKALAKVPNGTVKSSELEREHGRLIWSFDISKPTSKNVTEVNVDAKTGKIVAVHTETPAKEKREAAVENSAKQ